MYDILVIDDEADIRDLICDILHDNNYLTRAVSNSLEAFDAIEERAPSAVVLDIWLQGSELDGLGILEILQQKYAHIPVIMISGHGTIETAVSSIRMGAYDYIEKPFSEDRLTLVLSRACEAASLKKENAVLRRHTETFTELMSQSQIMLQLKSSIAKLAPTASRVMITGPSGSGKEVVAREIHRQSKRKDSAFIMLNAATFPEHIEEELFGTEEAGSISIQKNPRKVGTIEQAHHGVLFIDEVTDLPASTQSKLLRFLQKGTFECLGTNRQITADVRLITATSKDIEQEVRDGRFREDLYYRLNVVPLRLPSLAERKADIEMLANYFLKQASELLGLPLRTLAEDAVIALQTYNWPGNIRQLRNVMEWLLIMAPGNPLESIRASMLPPEVLMDKQVIIQPESNTDIMSLPLKEAREIFERQYLTAQINRFNGNISRTSSFIGMERSALHRKLKMLNIHTSESKAPPEKEKETVSS